MCRHFTAVSPILLLICSSCGIAFMSWSEVHSLLPSFTPHYSPLHLLPIPPPLPPTLSLPFPPSLLQAIVLSANRSFIAKFDVVDVANPKTAKGDQLVLYLFSDSIEVRGHIRGIVLNMCVEKPCLVRGHTTK